MKKKTSKAMKEMFGALHIAEMCLVSGTHTRILQPGEKSATETIVAVIQDAIKCGKKEGCVCECH